jgi:tripartite ATP-independent transporter DctP family solute receptor
MMLKKFRCLALVLALILVVVSCTTFATVKPIKLAYGHVFPADYFFCKGDLKFKELVEKNSKGQILVDFFPNYQLGNQTEQLQATRTNAQQITIISPGTLSPIWQKMGTLELPYLFRDDAHHIKVMNQLSSLIDQDEMANKTGLRILNARRRAARQLTTKFPVNKLEDIKGLKMRSPENTLYLALWKALGTVPTVIPGSEIYTALATGVVDGQENPLDDIYSKKLYEQVKFCALTSHMRETSMMVINEKCWKGLTNRQQKILTAAAAVSAKMGIADVIKDEKKAHDLLVEAGMKFTEPNLVPFREKAKTIWNQFGEKELIEKIEKIK